MINHSPYLMGTRLQEEFVSFGKVRPDQPEPEAGLLRAAKDAAERAYAPHSRFKVGCAVRTGNGSVYSGCNVESESFPAGVCAERNAVAAAVLGEGDALSLEQILLYALDSSGNHAPCSPCGICRQVFVELARTAQVGFFNSAGYVEMSADELLPHSFQGQLK